MAADLGLCCHGDAEPAPGLADLAVKVRRPDPPGWLRAELARTLSELAFYPDPSPAGQVVAARHGRDAGEVLLTAGAAEGFVLIAQALRRRRGTFPGLGPDWLRIAVREPGISDAFADSLREVLI